MENEGNSLLELPLETEEILEEVHIPSNHVDTVSGTHGDNVGEMLIDEGTQSGISGMDANNIDFEFVNTDLGSGTDFNIENTGVFGMSDNGMDVREDCEYLFQDSSCFDDRNTCINKQVDSGTVTQNGLISIPNSGKLNLYKDLGLKLQVIPLNNLQYVSTIQTSKGLHILAIPSQTSIPSNCDDVTFQQICQKSKVISPEISLNQYLENRIENVSLLQPLTVESSETLTKTKSNIIMNSRMSVKDAILSNSTRKLRNSVNKKLIICGKSSLRKGCVQSLIKNKSLFNQRKDAKEVLDDRKSKNVGKHRMVSILKKSVTNKLKQANNVTSRTKNKEIKVTFHLKPQSSSGKGKIAVDIGTKPSIVITSENKEEPEIYKQKADNIIQDLDIDKYVKPLRISEKDTILISEKRAMTKRANASNKSPPLNQVEADKAVEENEKMKHPGLGIKQIQSFEDNDNVLNFGTTEKKSVRRVHQCKTCLTTFIRQGHLKNHLKTHTTILTELRHTPETFSDNYRHDSEHFLDEDLAVNDKFTEFSNSQLEKEIPEVSSAYSVKKPEHNSCKVLTCEFCEMSFMTQGNLTRHKLTHSMISDRKVRGRFQCDDCDKSFMQKCDLKRHIKIHSGMFPFTCLVCAKGFIRQSDLCVHEKFHTQEKQHICHLCSKSYFQKGDLSRHMRKSHPDVCQFTCQDCNKKYTVQKTLYHHIRTKH